MAEFFGGDESRVHEPGSRLRAAVGLILLAVGLALAGWVVVSLIGVLSADEAPPLVAAMIPAEGKPVAIGMPEGRFTISPETFKPVGYLVVCFVHAIIGTIAGLIIQAGSAVLQPDVSKGMQKLTESLNRK